MARFVISACLFVCLAQAYAASPVKCDVRLDSRAITVAISVPASSDRQPIFSLNDWAGVQNFASDIYFLKAVDSARHELKVTRVDHTDWRVESGGRPFTLEYAVICQKPNHMGTAEFNHFHATLLPDWMFAWGYAWLFRPKSMAVLGFPVEAKFDFGPYRQGEISVDTAKPTTFDHLADSLLVAGDYRHVVREQAGRKLSIWMTGTWKFGDQEFTDAVANIEKAQLDMMGPLPAGQLMIALVPGAPQSNGGTAVEHAIAVYPSPEATLTSNDAASLKVIAHEHFHLWNGHLVHPDGSKPEGYYKWFQEGLTEYYALVTLLRTGLITPEQFLGWANRAYARYQENPVALTATASVLADKYWTNYDYQSLPYDKGVVQGLMLDLKLRSSGSDLDHVMRAVIATDRAYTDDSIGAALKSVGGPGMDEIQTRYLVGADALPILTMAGDLGIDAAMVKKAVFELGLDIGPDKKIASVLPGSNADKAGFKAGETVSGVSYYRGDPTKPAIIGVMRAGQREEIRFVPAKEVEEVQFSPTPKTLAAIRRIGGQAP